MARTRNQEKQRGRVGDLLEEYLSRISMTAAELARESGLPQRIITGFMQGDRLRGPTLRRNVLALLKVLFARRAFRAPHEPYEFLEAIEEKNKTANLLDEHNSANADLLALLKAETAALQPPTNLPPLLSPLIDRQEEVQCACTLLEPTKGERLLTLTGIRGIGKTRLALQVAEQLKGAFIDGVYLVELYAITDPNAVMTTIAQTLALKDHVDISPLEQLKVYLQDKRLLLLLENFEQVMGAALPLQELLASCPKLKVLVTSIMALKLPGEQEIPLPPLALPPEDAELADRQSLLEYPATELFVRRVEAITLHFPLTKETAPQIAEICRLLGGIPLAIELLVPRVKVFPTPEQLLRQLQRCRRKHRLLDLLTCARCDMPERHRALATAFRLTYTLLSPEEQRFFRQLSVFHGSFTQEAAEAVYGSSSEAASSVLDLIQALSETGLISYHEHLSTEPRYGLLAPLCEFGIVLLEATGEVEGTRCRYQEYYLHLAEQSKLMLRGRKQVAWQDLLEDEQENLRAILCWCWKTGQTAQGLQLAAHLLWFWFTRGHWREGREWLTKLLSQAASPVPSAILAKANFAAAYLAFFQGNVGLHTKTQLKQSIDLYEEVGDQAGRAYAQAIYALADFEPTTSRALLEQSLSILRSLGDDWGVSRTLIFLGYLIGRQGEWEQARVLFEESLTLSRKLGDKHGMAWSSLNLGDVAFKVGDYQAAAKHYRSSLAGFRTVKNELGMAWAQGSLATTQLRLGNSKAASKEFEESLSISYERLQDKLGTYSCLVGISELFVEEHCWKQAAITLGAARQVFETFEKDHFLHRPLPNLEALEAVVSKRLKEEVFTSLLSRGYEIRIESAIHYVLDELHQLVFLPEEEKKKRSEHLQVVQAHK